mmetsp:Transcript_10122/g.25341  ORF Transcript_10122/g.25341 Transcript_10122/m.25341 type:complete len:231 (+) Transcript_10122:530-1222(+)
MPARGTAARAWPSARTAACAPQSRAPGACARHTCPSGSRTRCLPCTRSAGRPGTPTQPPARGTLWEAGSTCRGGGWAGHATPSSWPVHGRPPPQTGGWESTGPPAAGRASRHRCGGPPAWERGAAHPPSTGTGRCGPCQMRPRSCTAATPWPTPGQCCHSTHRLGRRCLRPCRPLRTAPRPSRAGAPGPCQPGHWPWLWCVPSSGRMPFSGQTCMPPCALCVFPHRCHTG